MNAIFVELTPFQRVRADYLDDAAFHALQSLLLADPELGDGRQKGRRGGLRVVYYWWSAGAQFWLFSIYDKNELSDLTSLQRNLLKK